MKLYNLTNSALSIPMSINDNVRITIKPREVSENLVLTKTIVKAALLPLINLYGNKILVVANTGDRLVLETPGYSIPAENVVDDKEAQNRLKKVINDFNKSKNPKPNKPKENKPVSKPEVKEDKVKDDLNAGIPAKQDNLKSAEVEMPEVTILKEDNNKK